MRYKILIALAAMSLPMQSGVAMARTQAIVSGKPTMVANSVTVLIDGDRQTMERERAALENIPRVAPLAYTTVSEMPDARKVGYGDCKTLAKTYRSALAVHGFIPDSMLIALVTTEKGDPHAVLLIRTDVNGRLVDMVYDSRVLKIETLEKSMQRGYQYNGLEAYPEGPFLDWNGRSYQ